MRFDLELTSNGYEDEPAFVKDFINGDEMPEMTLFFHLALILYCLKTIFWLIRFCLANHRVPVPNATLLGKQKKLSEGQK
nr:unnamed protein product [Haemonchus contortus]